MNTFYSLQRYSISAEKKAFLFRFLHITAFLLYLCPPERKNESTMQKNLVIVESPAKAKTIEKFLGKDYKVMSSYGHIRDLKKKDISVDLDTFEPHYEIPADKKKIVTELRAEAKEAQTVWLASDEDREGEAIAWHLQQVLGLDYATTKRIVFHEITKDAILKAIREPRGIDMALVDAQQARRVLDRIVGFNLSPVLWRKVKPSLSAGRVQSVAVRLIVEREREIQKFVSQPYYRLTAVFNLQGEGENGQLHSELDHRFDSLDEGKAFLERCKGAVFTVASVQKKPIKRSPAPPFTTSTLQQEAARKLGFSVAQTMRLAQHLYESGLITYMRTDSVNLSSLCINASKAEVKKLYGEDYSRPRNFKTSTRGAQEAHEAIRPTYMDRHEIEGTAQEKRLYDLIWKRTLASQMAEAQLEKTTVSITMDKEKSSFVANGEVVKFDGFLKVYRESTDEDAEGEESKAVSLPAVKEGENLQREEIVLTERFTQGPVRYTEGSLVKKMEELGIGRPSTYAPTISTIQQRQYVAKGDKAGTEREYIVVTLKKDKLTSSKKKETVGKEKGKLIPTDVGIVVNDFLVENFPQIMEYNFTADIEKQFDEIAEGEQQWSAVMQDFWKEFSPDVDRVMNARSEHKVGERELGVDPKSGKKVFVKIGRFGPVAQMGEATDEEKPRFAQLPKDKSIETITLSEALELFRLPRVVGNIDGKEATIGVGRFGPYILYDKQYTSLPETDDPLTISLERVKELLAERVERQQQRKIKTFEEDKEMEILNGRYGPYISYKGKNYRIPKKQHSTAGELSYDDCKKLIEEASAKAATTSKRGRR